MSNQSNQSNQSSPQPPVQGPDVQPPKPGEPSKDPDVHGIWLDGNKTFFGYRSGETLSASEASVDSSGFEFVDTNQRPNTLARRSSNSTGFAVVVLIGTIAAVLGGPNLLNLAGSALRSTSTQQEDCWSAIAYSDNGKLVIEVNQSLTLGETYLVNPEGYNGFGVATVSGSSGGISWLTPEFPADAEIWAVCSQ